jgi:hypothetical protein
MRLKNWQKAMICIGVYFVVWVVLAVGKGGVGLERVEPEKIVVAGGLLIFYSWWSN